ncbi:MAG: MoaD/ThiS family protein [Acidobacteriota bacterium]
MTVTFELFGVARARAGRKEVRVAARTIGSALSALEEICPQLSGPVVAGGRLTRHFRLSLNGRGFVSDPSRTLREGDRLILLSAEAGG